MSTNHKIHRVRTTPLVEAIQAVIECAAQAPNDLGGEQREFYLPRLTLAMGNLGKLFPRETLNAMGQAQDPYGESLVD